MGTEATKDRGRFLTGAVFGNGGGGAQIPRKGSAPRPSPSGTRQEHAADRLPCMRQ